MKIEKLLVQFYLYFHGTLHLPGAGWLIRRLASVVPGLHSYPLSIPGIGVARLDFRDRAAFGILNILLGERDDIAHVIRWMECFIEPGTVLWDVGANVGYLCLDLIQTHPEIAAIHAFEPNPAARKVIESMFSQHLKVKVHPVGLGQQDQTLSLSFEPSGSETGSLVREFGPTNRVAVDVRHGDAYRTRNRIPLPDVLKIDVEGFEPQVFVGLSDTIEKSRPVILFEHHFLSEEDTLAVIPPGYHAYLILKSGDLTKDLARRAESSDCLLVPEEKLNRLPVTLR